jgi:hypothetical protein
MKYAYDILYSTVLSFHLFEEMFLYIQFPYGNKQNIYFPLGIRVSLKEQMHHFIINILLIDLRRH